MISQIGTAGHPLVVVTATVIVGTVEATPREGPLEPFEQSLVADVHPKGDLWLPSVPTKVAFSDEQSDQEALFELRSHRCDLLFVFHRSVTRETRIPS
jgi:hypothetical protein